MKCLAKEPERRYPSAQHLADELQRCLKGEPIQARPIKTPERAWPWCRRNPVVAGLTAAIDLALVSGTIISTCFMVETVCVFSPDIRYALSGARDKTIRLWDISTGKELHRFDGHSDRIDSLAFSPTGDRFVSCSKDGTARLWDVAQRRELRVFPSGPGLLSVALCPKGERMLVGGWRRIQLFGLNTGQELCKLEGAEKAWIRVACLPDGRRVLTADYDIGTIYEWTLPEQP